MGRLEGTPPEELRRIALRMASSALRKVPFLRGWGLEEDVAHTAIAHSLRYPNLPLHMTLHWGCIEGIRMEARLRTLISKQRIKNHRGNSLLQTWGDGLPEPVADAEQARVELVDAIRESASSSNPRTRQN